MGVREAINRNPIVATAASLLFVIVVATVIFFQFRDAGGASTLVGDPKSWYTDDDGKTWFADKANKVVPFDRNGKKAYRCYVWTCDGGATKFISHLERIKPSVRATLGNKERIEPWEMLPGSDEVKAPLTGETGWVELSNPAAQRVVTPRCPDGKMPVPVQAQ
jgi:hypothetical protein